MIAPTRLLFPALLLLGACATVKKYTPDLSRLPKPPLPSFAGLKKLTRVLPGMPETDSTSAEDPKLPFEAGQKLAQGHTLRLHIYEGARSTKRIYNGVVMVDADGLIQFEEAGSARVGGLDLVEAAETVARTFRLAGFSPSLTYSYTNVHSNLDLYRFDRHRAEFKLARYF